MFEGGVLKEDAPLKEYWDQYVVPVGPDTLDGIYVLNWSIRSALTFGNHKRGEARKCLDYTKKRIHAFGITFGEIPDDWYAMGAGAILMGYPIVSDSPSTPEIRPTGVTVREELVVETDYAEAGADVHRYPRRQSEGGEGRHSRRLRGGFRRRARPQGGDAGPVRLQVLRCGGVCADGRGERDSGRGDPPRGSRRRLRGRGRRDALGGRGARGRDARCTATSRASSSARSTAGRATPWVSCTPASATRSGAASARRPSRPASA